MFLIGSVSLQLSNLCFQSHAAPGDVDLSFDPGSGINGPVRAVAVQPDGKVIISGQFTTVKGVASVNIARLNVDGSGDASFNVAAGSIESANAVALQSDGKVLVGHDSGMSRLNSNGSLDANFYAGSLFVFEGSPNVYSVVVQPDGRVLVGGNFYTDNGTNSVYGMARLNSDGSLDSSFVSGGSELVNSITLQPDGKVVVGGSGFVLRLNTNGSLDSSFNLGTGLNGSALSLRLQSDGKVLVSGDFSTVNGTNRYGIARLNANGSLDSSFDPGTGVTNTSGAVAAVNAMALQTDGKVLIGGQFTIVNGTNRNRIAQLNANGTLDSGFEPGTGVNNNVYSLALQSDGKVLIGGDFTTLNGANRNFLARLNSNGSSDGGFDPGRGVEVSVSTLVLQPDGKVLIGGLYTFINGTNQYASARLNADGSLDGTFVSSTNFHPDLATLFPGGACPPGYECWTNSYLTALAVQPDGKVLVVGYSSTVACEPFPGECTSSSRTFLARVNADGSSDASFATGIDGPVLAFAFQPDGKIVIGGSFYTINNTPRSGIARLNGDGSLDTSFTSVPGIYSVASLALQADGSILAGYPSGIVRLGSNGSREICFNPVTDGTVYSLKVQPDGKVLLGGSFSTVNGVTRSGIARLNSNGSLDSSFNPGTGANGTVSSLALQPDGNVLLGGNFTTINGIVRTPIARLIGGSGSVVGPPLRIFSAANNAVTVAWPSSSASATLQQRTNLATSTWVTVTNAPATIGLEKQVTISSSIGQRFFRLSNADPAPPPPPAPTGLVATAGDGSISLSWVASPEATGHHVLRGTNYGGPFTLIASPATTNYTDTTVVNGTFYSYVVSVTYPCGESFASPPVGAIPQAAPPTVHVQSITMSFVAQGARYNTRAVVRVVNNLGTPVSGATVTGNFTGSISNPGLTGVTTSDGYATITSFSTIKNGTVTFTVTGVASSLGYNPAANVVTSATITR